MLAQGVSPGYAWKKEIFISAEGPRAAPAEREWKRPPLEKKTIGQSMAAEVTVLAALETSLRIQDGHIPVSLLEFAE